MPQALRVFPQCWVDLEPRVPPDRYPVWNVDSTSDDVVAPGNRTVVVPELKDSSPGCERSPPLARRRGTLVRAALDTGSRSPLDETRADLFRRAIKTVIPLGNVSRDCGLS